MIATCPRCQSDFNYNENDAGKVSDCPTCRLQLTLPELTPEALDQLIKDRNGDEEAAKQNEIKRNRNAKIAIASIVVLLILMALADGIFSKPWGGVLYGGDYDNGNLMVYGYRVKGIQEGEWKYWYETGRIKRIENYKKGLLHGIQTDFWEDDGEKWRANLR